MSIERLNFKEFTELALKTESLKNPLNSDCEALGLNKRIVHSVIGAATERDEYMDALESGDRVNALEELGDMLWYAAILIDEVGCDIECISTNVYPIDGLDITKKTMFYGKELDLESIKTYACNLVGYANNKILFLGGEPEVVMATIINKLKSRYGDKFDTDRAGNRDLTKERKVLEEGLE